MFLRASQMAPLLPDYTEFVHDLSTTSATISILASHTGSADHVFYSENFAFHVSVGQAYPGGLVGKTLWHVYTMARRSLAVSVVPAHVEFRHGNLPAFHLEINFGQFTYGDLIDLCQALRILTMEMNDGQVLTYGGNGSRWFGRIYRNGQRGWAVGRFFFD